jgi:CO/xanthine dehydrogenase Mo-binding subunit
MTATEQATAGHAAGVRRRRLDAADKVTGRASYAGDGIHRGLLHARPVLSLYPHARIVSIDKAAALEVPGVRAVLTADDLGVVGGSGRKSEPLARSEAVFAGQPVALVVADSEAAAADGVELVAVDYEPLPAVVDLEQAILPGAPPARSVGGAEERDVAMHGETGAGQETDGGEPRSTNVLDVIEYSEGDVEDAFAGCAAVAEGRFRTSWIHQCYLEPQVAVAWPEGDGGLGVRSSTQTTFWLRSDLARIYGLPLTKVRVEAATLGGGFGGKIGLIEPLVAGAALSLGRPVRLALTRSEDFAAGVPGPGLVIDLKVGARADGRLAALEARLLADSGAFSDSAPVTFAGGKVGGAYSFESWHVTTYAVQTNRFGAGAYRAPLATPTAFALESLIDELAVQLDLDPIALRLENVPSAGDPRVDGIPWQQTGLRETLETIRAHPLWQRRADLPENEGIGFACGLFPGGKMGASAVCRMDADGGITVLSGYVDMTGTDTGVAAIAAEITGVPLESVRVASGDTNEAPQAGVSGGSMVTYCLGNAVAAAAGDAREQILRYASDQLEIDPADLEIVDGEVRARGAPQRSIALETIGSRLTSFGASHAPIEGHGTTVPPDLAPSAAAAVVHVRVDPETGHVELLAYVAAQDCGRALNPALVEGQMHGGAVQSIGYALHEQLVHDEEGELVTRSFLNYSLPTIESVPAIETLIVEVPSPHGPLGARGIGESAIVPGAPAIGNAIRAATGMRLHELPMTPARVWRALRRGDDAVEV